MRQQASPYRFEPSGFRPFPPSVALMAAYLLLAVAVAAQANLDSLLAQARTAEKGGDYGGAARIYEQA